MSNKNELNELSKKVKAISRKGLAAKNYVKYCSGTTQIDS